MFSVVPLISFITKINDKCVFGMYVYSCMHACMYVCTSHLWPGIQSKITLLWSPLIWKTLQPYFLGQDIFKEYSLLLL